MVPNNVQNNAGDNIAANNGAAPNIQAVQQPNNNVVINPPNDNAPHILVLR